MLAFAADTKSSWDLHLMLCPLAEAPRQQLIAACWPLQHRIVSSCWQQLML